MTGKGTSKGNIHLYRCFSHFPCLLSILSSIFVNRNKGAEDSYVENPLHVYRSPTISFPSLALPAHPLALLDSMARLDQERFLIFLPYET